MEDENGRIEQNSKSISDSEDVSNPEVEVLPPDELLRQFDGVHVAGKIVFLADRDHQPSVT